MRLWPFRRAPKVVPMTTILDGQRAVWMWQYDAQGEQTIGAVATTLLQYAKSSVLLIKAMSGSAWQSTFDTGISAISSLPHLQQTIADGAAAGITVIPWVEATGPGDAPAHAALGPTLVVDLEQPPDFWQADPTQIAGYLAALRTGGVQNLFVCLDPRPSALAWAQIASWRQSATALLPMCYWPDFQRPYSESVPYVQALLPYGLPVYPVVEFNSQPADLAAFWAACQAIGVESGVSLWVLGDANAAQLGAFSTLAVKRTPRTMTNDDLIATERYLLAQPPDPAGAIAYLEPFA